MEKNPKPPEGTKKGGDPRTADVSKEPIQIKGTAQPEKKG